MFLGTHVTIGESQKIFGIWKKKPNPVIVFICHSCYAEKGLFEYP